MAEHKRGASAAIEPSERPHKTLARGAGVASPLAALHRDLLALVFAHLKQRLLLRVAALVCKYWRSVAICCMHSVALRIHGPPLGDDDTSLPVARFTALSRLDMMCNTFSPHVGDLPRLQELVLGCAGRASPCAKCAALSRFTTLTALTVKHGALNVLSGGFPLLEKLDISASSIKPPIVIPEHFSQRSLPALRSLTLSTLETIDVLAPFLRLDLMSRLTALTIRCSEDESTLHSLVPTLRLPNVTSLSLQCLVSDVELSFLLERCPALRDLAVDTTTATLVPRIHHLAPLLVGLRIDEPGLAESALTQCTRLARLEPLPTADWIETEYPQLYTLHASRLRCLNFIVGGPDSPSIVPFLAPFTSLTYLRINSDDLIGNPFYNIKLPNLERIWWDITDVERIVPAHYVAYILRRFLSWSPMRLLRIDLEAEEMRYADTDASEWGYLLHEADAHPSFRILRFTTNENSLQLLRPLLRRWTERLVLLTASSLPHSIRQSMACSGAGL